MAIYWIVIGVAVVVAALAYWIHMSKLDRIAEEAAEESAKEVARVAKEELRMSNEAAVRLAEAVKITVKKSHHKKHKKGTKRQY